MKGGAMHGMKEPKMKAPKMEAPKAPKAPKQGGGAQFKMGSSAKKLSGFGNPPGM